MGDDTEVRMSRCVLSEEVKEGCTLRITQGIGHGAVGTSLAWWTVDWGFLRALHHQH